MIDILPLLIPLFMLVPVYKIGRVVLVKKYKEKYELSLINGDKESAIRTGMQYYHLLSEASMKEKGIIDIENKIIEEFKAYNS